MIKRPPAATLIQSTMETSATSLAQTGLTRVSSALVTLRRIVNVKTIAAARMYIFAQKTLLAYCWVAVAIIAGTPVRTSPMNPMINHG